LITKAGLTIDSLKTSAASTREPAALPEEEGRKRKSQLLCITFASTCRIVLERTLLEIR